MNIKCFPTLLSKEKSWTLFKLIIFNKLYEFDFFEI